MRKYQYYLIQAIRNFFTQREFLDVLTPPMVPNPGMETHIHPFEVFSKRTGLTTQNYLHTSPEFYMKELLASDENFEKIFTVNYCYRDEPSSPIHRNQFLMLEWYRKHEHYTKIMQDCEELVQAAALSLQQKGLEVKKDYLQLTPQKATVQEIFCDFLDMDILNYLNREDLKRKIKLDFKDVPLPSTDCSWDDYFFLLFLNKIEPQFSKIPYLLLYEFPAPLAALSTIKPGNERVCERFEIYLQGVELCNCFNELTDYSLQKQRFMEQQREKENLYGYSLPEPTVLYNALEKGLPRSAGIALGVERLLLSLIPNINPFFTNV